MTATVRRILTDAQEGLGKETEDFAAGWLEVSATVSGDVRQTIMLGTDSKHYLDGRAVSFNPGGVRPRGAAAYSR